MLEKHRTFRSLIVLGAAAVMPEDGEKAFSEILDVLNKDMM